MYSECAVYLKNAKKASMIQRYISLLSIAVGGFAFVQGQGIVTLTDEGGEVVNGTVISVPSLPSDVTDTISLFAQLNGSFSDTTQVNLRRYEIWPVENSRN